MSDEIMIEVKCRDCDRFTVFESEEAAIESDWQKPSSFGIVKEDTRVHNAYCPDHA